MKRFSFAVLLVFTLASCGFQGNYRYSCQDPDNWENSDCKPPVCKVDGNCTATLLGWDPSETTVETVPTQETVAP